MQPWPLVRKNKLDSLFHEISFTSNLNCSSAMILCVRTSMNETRSSLLPTAIVLPSGAQAIFIFSPLVETVAAAFDDLDSQIRTEKG